MIESIPKFREDNGLERWQRWTEWPMVAFGLAFLVVLILPLATPLSPTADRSLSILNVGIWLVFVADYLLRVYLAKVRRTFIRTHILDLIVIVVPFLRPFRLLRLFAIVMSTTRRAGGLVVRRVTIYVIAVALIVMSTCAVLVYDAERHAKGANITSLSDALWWAFTTVTTVGYGDRFPVTDKGRALAALLMVTGIALIGTITAAVASAFVGMVRRSQTEQSEHDVEEMSVQMAALLETVEQLRLDIAQLASTGDGGLPGVRPVKSGRSIHDGEPDQ